MTTKKNNDSDQPSIWDYSEKLQDENAGWQTKWKFAVEMAARAENERDEARSEIKKLKEELESHAWTISPAMAQAKIDELVEQRDRLLAEREQWRMSSVCRELREQRDRLAEALRELCETLLNDKPRDITESLYKAGDALAAWKGGSDDN
jgi:predicted transcriptional regulator